MRINPLFTAALCVCVFAGCQTPGEPTQTKTTTQLPPLPAGVTELKFGEFFQKSTSPMGLELSDKLKSLDGRRVRMLGYMVREEHGSPGKFMFAAVPAELHDHDSVFADDLPPALVHVTVPTNRDAATPYVHGLMLLTGKLSVGVIEEPDGRNSLVRLALDPPEAFSSKPSSGKGAQFARSTTHQH